MEQEWINFVKFFMELNGETLICHNINYSLLKYIIDSNITTEYNKYGFISNTVVWKRVYDS